MTDHLFLCMHASNQTGTANSRFLQFETLEQADAYLRNWLTTSCALDCYRGAEEEAALRAENGGELPELAFACPTLESPADLERYSGYYYYASGGTVQLFLLAMYDSKSALKFRREATKEYELDKTFSDAADEMIEMLSILERSFSENLNYQEAFEKVADLIQNEGLPLF